jgi:hypothetical protein
MQFGFMSDATRSQTIFAMFGNHLRGIGAPNGLVHDGLELGENHPRASGRHGSGVQYKDRLTMVCNSHLLMLTHLAKPLTGLGVKLLNRDCFHNLIIKHHGNTAKINMAIAAR